MRIDFKHALVLVISLLLVMPIAYCRFKKIPRLFRLDTTSGAQSSGVSLARSPRIPAVSVRNFPDSLDLPVPESKTPMFSFFTIKPPNKHLLHCPRQTHQHTFSRWIP